MNYNPSPISILFAVGLFMAPTVAFSDAFTIVNDDWANPGTPKIRFLDVSESGSGVNVANAWLDVGYITDWDEPSTQLQGKRLFEKICEKYTSAATTASPTSPPSPELGAGGWTEGTTFAANSGLNSQNNSTVYALIYTTYGNQKILSDAKSFAVIQFKNVDTDDLLTWGNILNVLPNSSPIQSIFGSKEYVASGGENGGPLADWYSSIWIGDYSAENSTVEMINVPEPSIFGLFSGIIALGFVATRRRRKQS